PMLAAADAICASSLCLQDDAQSRHYRSAHKPRSKETRFRPNLFHEDLVRTAKARRNQVSSWRKAEEIMERKTHFESEEDVEAYFAGQTELWDEPKPQPPDYLWQRIEQARLLNVNQPPKSH